MRPPFLGSQEPPRSSSACASWSASRWRCGWRERGRRGRRRGARPPLPRRVVRLTPGVPPSCDGSSPRRRGAPRVRRAVRAGRGPGSTRSGGPPGPDPTGDGDPAWRRPPGGSAQVGWDAVDPAGHRSRRRGRRRRGRGAARRQLFWSLAERRLGPDATRGQVLWRAGTPLRRERVRLSGTTRPAAAGPGPPPALRTPPPRPIRSPRGVPRVQPPPARTAAPLRRRRGTPSAPRDRSSRTSARTRASSNSSCRTCGCCRPRSCRRSRAGRSGTW